jgi:hypothetical protein
MPRPVANRDHTAGTNGRQKMAMAVPDTFDWYSPRYDRPLSERRVAAQIEASGFSAIQRTMQGGLTVVRKAS